MGKIINNRKSSKDFKNILEHISYDKILNQIRDGIFITDLNRKIVFWSLGAEKLTGLKAEKMVNQSCHTALSTNKNDQPEICSICGGSCPLRKAMDANTSGVYPHMVFLKSLWGMELPVTISVAPIHDDQGDVIGAIVVFRDKRDEFRQQQLAGEIQKQMITLGQIHKNGFFVDTLYKPVNDIGGDFIEAFFLDDKSLVATVADATGHGISASLFTVVYKTLLHSSFATLHDPAEVLNSVNKGFLNTTKVDGYYLTATMVVINPHTLRGKLSSAGHPPGLIFTPTEKGYRLREELRLQSSMIGVEESSHFQEIPFTLNKKDFLLLTSDGIIEAECTGDTFFGIEGIEEFFSTYQGNDHLKDLLSHVREASKFMELIDDVSLIKISPIVE